MSRELSRTALMVAACRGRASARVPPLCMDPWALALAGEDGARDADAYAATNPHLELWVALRTARIDTLLLRALDEGIAQVVILGAGLDSRAARLAREGVRYFEVDALRTQTEKRARVAALPGYAAPGVSYVTCDFEHEDFLARLAASGFDVRAPAFFVWEGVSYYLPEAAVRATLQRIAAATHPRSTVVFDTFGKRFVAGQVKDEDDVAARSQLAAMGEPLRFGIDDLIPLLYEVGFGQAASESFDAIALNLTGSYERARKFRFQSLTQASRARVLG